MMIQSITSTNQMLKEKGYFIFTCSFYAKIDLVNIYCLKTRAALITLGRRRNKINTFNK